MASFTVYVQTNTKIHINVTLSHMFTYVYLHLTLTCQSGAQISILALMQNPIASSGAPCRNISISLCKWVSRLRGRAYVRGGISHCQSHYCLLLLWPSRGTSPCFSFGFLGLDEVFTIGASWAVSSPQSRVPGKLLFCCQQLHNRPGEAQGCSPRPPRCGAPLDPGSALSSSTRCNFCYSIALHPLAQSLALACRSTLKNTPREQRYLNMTCLFSISWWLNEQWHPSWSDFCTSHL